MLEQLIGKVKAMRSRSRRRAPARRIRRTVLRLEELGQRILPTAYYWDPTSGQNIDAQIEVNGIFYFANWDLGSMGSHTHPTTLPNPNGTDTVIFDGSSGYNGRHQYYNGNVNCSVDVNLAAITVLQNGYNATITIGDGIEWDINGYQDSDIGVDDFILAFAGPNANPVFKNGSSFMGNFQWLAGGRVNIDGGQVYVGDGAKLNQSTASTVNINSGTLSLGPTRTSTSSTFQLLGAGTDINVNTNGTLDISLSENNNNTALVSSNVTGPQINNNGTTYLIGTGGGTEGSIDVPFENHAALYADTGGTWNFGGKDASGNSLSMDAGEIYMMGQVSFWCSNSYTQSGGTLTIGDDEVETLRTVNNGTADNFNGGKIVFNSAFGYGTLAVGGVIFNGVEIDMRIAGNGPASDLIKCVSGNTCTIMGNSVMNVTAVNAVTPGTTWTLIQPNGLAGITGDFLPANIHLPTGVKEKAGALPNSWQCNS